MQAFFTQTCAIHMDKYVPFDTGVLAQTVVKNGKTTDNVTTSTITYDQEYAEVVYNGMRNGKIIHYNTDKHEYAGPYWDKRMVSAEADDVVKEVQDYVNREVK